METNSPVIKSNITIVNSIEEITEYDKKYAHASKPFKWIQIEKEPDGTFTVYGMVSGSFPTSITGSNSNYIKHWKTFNGVKRYLTLCLKSGEWGMGHWKQQES